MFIRPPRPLNNHLPRPPPKPSQTPPPSSTPPPPPPQTPANTPHATPPPAPETTHVAVNPPSHATRRISGGKCLYGTVGPASQNRGARSHGQSAWWDRGGG